MYTKRNLIHVGIELDLVLIEIIISQYKVCFYKKLFRKY